MKNKKLLENLEKKNEFGFRTDCMAYYKKIKGKNYDKKLLELVESFTSKKGDGRISLEDAKILMDAVKDSNAYTTVEKDTIAYIRKNYKFTESADKWFRTEIRKWAATKTQKKAPIQSTSYSKKAGSQEEKSVSSQKSNTEDEIIPLVEEIEGSEKILPLPTIPKMDAVSTSNEVPEEISVREEIRERESSFKWTWLLVLLLFFFVIVIILFLWKPQCSKSQEITQNPNPFIEDKKEDSSLLQNEETQNSLSKEYLKKLRFEFQKGKAELTPDSLETIDKIAELLKRESSIRLKIIGHSCDVGSKNFNQKISLARADLIKNLLVQKSIEPSRVLTEGKGEKEPLFPNDTEENRAKNRRVEFQIIE